MSASIHQQAQSPLFRLPAELRVDIYELAFTVKIKTRTSKTRKPKVELVKAGTKMPPSSLLRTCKAINFEARDSFQNQSQVYWEKTVFTIENLQDVNLVSTLGRLSATNFANIRCIRITIRDFLSVVVMDITNEGGDWRLHMQSARPRPGVLVWLKADCFLEMYAALVESAEQCVGLAGGEKRLKHLLALIEWLKHGKWE